MGKVYNNQLTFLQEVPQTKPASLGLSIRKDIFMSPKKEVIELGVRNYFIKENYLKTESLV